MKRIYTLLWSVLLLQAATAQEETMVRQRIDQLFAAMYQRDTAALRECFIPAAGLYTYHRDSKGNPRPKGESVNDFIRGVASIGDSPFEEKLTGWHCLIDEGIASVWTPYTFFFEGKFSHCGVNSFELIKVHGDWKISHLTDTRRKGDCYDPMEVRRELDSLINQWHHAAAVADEDAFFGFMPKDGIYIGTDATERWLRDELREWSAEYFSRESAWDFKPVSRSIDVDASGISASFDELLDTWMGVCRSTGMLEKRDGQWKLVYYHLSIAVPNDVLDGYRALIGKK